MFVPPPHRRNHPGERGPPSAAAQVRATLLTKVSAAKRGDDAQGGEQHSDTNTTAVPGTQKQVRDGEEGGGKSGSMPWRDARGAATTRTTATTAPPQDQNTSVALRRNDGTAAAAAAGQRRIYFGSSSGSGGPVVGKSGADPQQQQQQQQRVRKGEEEISPGCSTREENKEWLWRARLARGIGHPGPAARKATPANNRPASSPCVRAAAAAASKRKVPRRQRNRPEGRSGLERRGYEEERRGVHQEGAASPGLSPLLSLLRLSSAAISPSRKQASGTALGGNTGGDGSDGDDDVGGRPRGEEPARIPGWGKEGWRRPDSATASASAAVPSLQTTRIVKGAFEVAERCATTAVGR